VDDKSADAMLAAARSVVELTRHTIIHEIAHGKDMGEHGKGYMEACDDILGWLENEEHMRRVFGEKLKS
jgi:predicted metal-dependent hydrolase